MESGEERKVLMDFQVNCGYMALYILILNDVSNMNYSILVQMIIFYSIISRKRCYFGNGKHAKTFNFPISQTLAEHILGKHPQK